MSVYAPLERRLSEMDQPIVRLSFEEIERLLGRRLPDSARDARIKRQWWANTDTHVQARAWLRAGRKAKLDVARDEVAFVQDQPAALEIGLSRLTPAALAEVRRRASADAVGLGEAAASLLNEAARARREAILDRVDELRRLTRISGGSVVEMIREDRDGR